MPRTCAAGRLANMKVRRLHNKAKVLNFAFMLGDILQLESLSAGYAAGGRACPVVDGFTASASAGTFTCVLGTNGAGKSTLLRTMAGLQPPLAGTVLYGGRNIGSLSPRQLARTAGIVLTDRQVFSTQLKARELVLLGRSPYTGFFGVTSRHDSDIADKAMKIAGAEGFAGRPVNTLSDGERQKVMIAKVLAQQTPVILLDEPTAFLDFPSETEMFRLMRRLAHEEGKTVVAATHNIAAALQTADRLWVLHKGETPVAGTPQDLAAAGKLDMFFESAGVTFDRKRLSFQIEPD